MDNCDLEKLDISVGKLCPPFTPHILSYKVTVPSNISRVTLQLLTSDCGASYKILFGDGSNVIELNDGINSVNIEVVAEDGTSKTYCVEVSKLSASAAKLSRLEIAGDVHMHPEFSPNIFEYSSTVNLSTSTVAILLKPSDMEMQVSVNGSDSAEPIHLTIGDTIVRIKVCSADGTKSQVYTLFITREQIPLPVTFKDVKDQMEYECPFSLTAFYRPVSISSSDPKHIYSAPCIDAFTRRSKIDPLDEHPLGEGWKVPELDLDRKMSTALVKCFFAYRGCECMVKLSEVGLHAKDCPHKPPTELDTKDVIETEWYKRHFASSSSLEIETKHTLETRSWEKQLWKAIGEANVQQLCRQAKEQLMLYRERLPKPGDATQYEQGCSPLDHLHQAAVHHASAIKLKPRDPHLHFLLGRALEEQHYSAEMYGLKKTSEEDTQDLGLAKAAGREEEVLAICKLHGFPGRATLESQLKALDTEVQQLKEQGLSGKADYVQSLSTWLSKRAGQDGRVCVSDEESCLHRALLKYLDAWSLSPDNWEYNLHVGRLLLQQMRRREALPHLQTALALRPSHPALRFYAGLALLQQEGGLGVEETWDQSVLFLQQGLEHALAQCCSPKYQDRGDGWNVTDPLSTVNAQFLRGCLLLGELLQRTKPAQCPMSAEQVYHTVVILAVQGVCKCVSLGQVAQQLEWVLLDAHFALLQCLIQQPTSGKQLWITRRCQALSALIRLTAIAPCRELLNMQEKVCQVGVVAMPRSSQALYLLGLVQLAQHDDDPDSERGQTALADARLSFQSSMDLEGTPLAGVTPHQLTTQKWWQDQLSKERKVEKKMEKAAQPSAVHTGGASQEESKGGRGKGAPARGGAKAAAKISTPGRECKHSPTVKPGPRGASRGQRGAACAAKIEVTAKPPVKPNGKMQPLPRKTNADSCPTPANPVATEAIPVEEPLLDSGCHLPTSLNCQSHSPRLGLARALSRSSETREQACGLYREVIAMAPEVHDAYIELAELLVKTDPLAAVDVYCGFPLKPFCQQTFDDAFIMGEIVHILMKQELYDHPQLGPNLIAYGKIMGLGCLEKYIEVLDGKFKTNLLKTVYAGVHDKAIEDEDLKEFFKFKCWI